MPNTQEWAASHGLCVADSVPPINNYNKAYNRTAAAVVSRTIILHCVAAVGYQVDSQLVVDWLKGQSLWDLVSPNEKAILVAGNRSDKECSDARWRQEAQWTLLWAISKVEALGLPTQTCDTRRLADEIMPALGDPTESFVSEAKLRPPSELLGEDNRVYNLHCYARQAYRENAMPHDLMYDVLFQRHYAFEWLGGQDNWDCTRTDT